MPTQKQRNNGINVRLDESTLARIDAIVSSKAMNRPSVIREGVEMRLSFETQSMLLRDVIENAVAEAVAVFRQESTLLMRGMAEASKASDTLNVQRIADFIEVIGSTTAPEPVKPASVGSADGALPRIPARGTL